MTTVLSVLLGVLVVLAITALTGYFVAQEFGYMAVDRSRLRARAGVGDAGAQRALRITRRTSFMLSGAQLGITVTGLLVGYVAEPLIGDGIGALLGGVGVPAGVGIAVGTVLALLFATVVQMVFGELFPKNLAIARPERVARALAMSTAIYLAMFGWLIRLFDAASNLLLKALRIEPVHDVEHAATPRDLEAIIDESRDSGDLAPELSVLLDRVLGFTARTARAAMIPRPRVASVRADATVTDLVERMSAAHSRYPVLGEGADDVLGVVSLRDVLARDPAAAEVRVTEVMRVAVIVPDSLPLLAVLERMRAAEDEFVCVLDEYGGLAGIITVEDIAEELVGEITDEHDPASEDATQTGAGWTVPGALHISEAERLVDAELPEGDYQTIGGLVVAALQRLAQPGDIVTVTAQREPGDEPDAPGRRLEITVQTVDRLVPNTVQLAWVPGVAPEQLSEQRP
ncbi:MAG: hemolysin family protein [Pseudonocardia sp.]